MSSTEAKLIYQKYDEMMELLRTYRERIYQQWVSRVDEDCSFNLGQPLLQRDAGSLIQVNFSKAVRWPPCGGVASAGGGTSVRGRGLCVGRGLCRGVASVRGRGLCTRKRPLWGVVSAGAWPQRGGGAVGAWPLCIGGDVMLG